MSEEQTEICWDKVYTEVNAWRGECMHHIACAEKAVTDTLLVLDAVKPVSPELGGVGIKGLSAPSP